MVGSSGTPPPRCWPSLAAPDVPAAGRSRPARYNRNIAPEGLMDHRFVRACAPLLLVCAQLYAADTWKVAGPPPASWQRDRRADLAAHRKGVMQEIGDKGILI